MKLKSIVFVLALFSFFLISSEASAHPGRTDANGGHTCRTNCASWGLSDGEYHYHGGDGSSSGGSTGDTYTAPIQETTQTQEVVTLPTYTPIPTRIPTKTPTRLTFPLVIRSAHPSGLAAERP